MKASLQQYVNCELPDVQAGLQQREQARGGEGIGLRGGRPDPRRSEEGLVWWGVGGVALRGLPVAVASLAVEHRL